MPQLNSPAIERADYDAGSATMQIVFRSGQAYHYAGVPLFVFRDLVLHASPGWFFQTHIRDRYRETRVEWDPCQAA